MKNDTFYNSLSPDKKFIVKTVLYLQLLQGIYVVMLGSVLPMMRIEYNISYKIGGLLLSSHQFGVIITGLLASFLPLYLGMKNSMVILNTVTYIGFGFMLLTGNIKLLLIGFLLSGIGRGAIVNYNNVIINDLAGENAGPLNLAHGFFAVGAFISPFVVLSMTNENASGWKYAIVCVVVLGSISIIRCQMMKLDNERGHSVGKSVTSLGFFKYKIFWITAAILFSYMSVEASIMGWMASYFIDLGLVNIQYSQALVSILWGALLIGRFLCIPLSAKFLPDRLLLGLSLCTLISFVILMQSTGIWIIISTIGLGLGMSGIYASSVSNIGWIFREYPLAMGIFCALSGVGAVIMPSLMGVISDIYGIHFGMTTLIIVVLALVILSFWNRIYMANNRTNLE